MFSKRSSVHTQLRATGTEKRFHLTADGRRELAEGLPPAAPCKGRRCWSVWHVRFGKLREAWTDYTHTHARAYTLTHSSPPPPFPLQGRIFNRRPAWVMDCWLGAFVRPFLSLGGHRPARYPRPGEDSAAWMPAPRAVGPERTLPPHASSLNGHPQSPLPPPSPKQPPHRHSAEPQRDKPLLDLPAPFPLVGDSMGEVR